MMREDFKMNQDSNEFLEKIREIIKDEISKIDIRKLSYERCLNNTIVILENYKTLKQFTAQVENVKFSKEEIDQAKEKELEKMMEEVFSSKEVYLESLYKKHLQTRLFLNFLESTFKEYIEKTEISMKPKSELKIAILSEVYMDGKDIKQFLYEHKLGYGRTFYYARNELYEELAVRIFGIYALKL